MGVVVEQSHRIHGPIHKFEYLVPFSSGHSCHGSSEKKAFQTA